MNRLRESKLTVLNYLTILLALLACGLFVRTSALQRQTQQAVENRHLLTRYANQVMDGSATLTNEVRAYAATGDTAHYDNYWNEVNTTRNRDTGVEAIREIGVTAGEEGLIAQMLASSNDLITVEESAMALTGAGNRTAALDLVYGPAYEQQIRQIRSLQEQFQVQLETRTTQTVESFYSQQWSYTVGIFICIGLMIVIQLVNSFVVRFRLLQPISAVQEEMERIAGGNLSSQFKPQTRGSEIAALAQRVYDTKLQLKAYIDDIAQVLNSMAEGDMTVRSGIEYSGDFQPIAQSLRTILDSLNNTLLEIDTASHQVAAGSQQLSAVSQTLSYGTTEQAATITQLNDSMSKIYAAATESAQTLVATTQQARQLETEMVHGSKQTQVLIESMEDLRSASGQIGKVIRSINDIAYQTNILALNAAVEAARAGAAGKGFAVVAQEVRTLASRSAESARETTALIELNLAAVEKGAASAQETARSVNNAVSVVDDLVKQMQGVEENANAAARSVEEVHVGLEQFSGVIQTNSATAEESAASSEELSSQADLLKTMVGRFRLQRNQPAYGETGYSDSSIYYLEMTGNH